MTVDEYQQLLYAEIGNLWKANRWCQVTTQPGKDKPSYILKVEAGDWIMSLGKYDGTTGLADYLHLPSMTIIQIAEARRSHFFDPDYIVFREPDPDWVDYDPCPVCP